MNFTLVAHCDWSVSARKRWMTVARLVDGTWVVSPPELVQESMLLITGLQTRAGPDKHVLIGFDFPIGLPEWYALQTGFQSFRKALATLGHNDWNSWFDVATHRSEISLQRPFYPMRPGGTSRSHQLAALGAEDPKLLLRRCELATVDRQAACSLFWTLGGNQVGKGAISGWLELIVPNLNAIGLWPFDGELSDLSRRFPVVLAETYPGDVYAQLGIGRKGWSKRRKDDRQRVGVIISDWLDARPRIDAAAVRWHLEDGFGADGAGEDRFDAFVGLLGMLAVVDGERGEGAPRIPAVITHEGWILGHQRQAL
ncbi:DUF429 domain-containing protein [Devosia elaeis]|uniref:Methyltransferase type 12 n=1 Tax=Devosia elaeis TaxID=1770058 RepID=A0A178I1J8_9HYPH|nr:DUF429 domain-containing protein [Devosia elaeis]OAM78879.1 methyltransferase type 12 [Devosia elaeis]